MGEPKAAVMCAGCGRVLLERRVVGPWSGDLSVAPPQFTEYRARPWAASVLSRTRLIGPENTIPLHEMPIDGPQVQVREVPMVCSRPCLETIVATYAHRTQFAEIHQPPDIKDGDDYLSHALGSVGPIPDAPSDDWIDPHERTAERIRCGPEAR